MSLKPYADIMAGRIRRLVRSRLFRYVGAYTIIVLATFLAGLQHFVLTLPKESRDALGYTDGIIVMTGGQQRLAGGLLLLSEGWAQRMLISGVGPGVSRTVLVDELELDDRLAWALFCCSELDFTADDTRGNALAARGWAEQNEMRSLRLVTASYHMPRALLVFASAMPEIELHQWPVAPDDLRLERWWRDQSMIRLLAREYAKYLAESLRR